MLALVFAAALSAFSPAPAATADSVPPWRTFFAGHWGCHGAFASGKPIAADVTFTPELDGRWLQYRHADRPPTTYQALGLWGSVDSSGRVVTVLHDNFGGMRRFASTGWRDGTLRFVRDSLDRAPAGERFTFRRSSDASFWFAYEVNRPGAAGWVLGDSLTCRREPA